jgi:DNA relaxase NicK
MLTLCVMVVFSNRLLGPSAELLVSVDAASELLREVAAAACPSAQARWEHELVSWLERCAASRSTSLDVADIAWTPEHFERQRRFLVEAIQRALASSRHGRALTRWCGMIEAHPRESVQVGRRWQWPSKQLTI